MKISSIPLAYRSVNRSTEIFSILSKYGLSDWISRLNIDFAKGIFKTSDGDALARQTREVRIRMALAELGPTFIKLGQLLSTRPELIGQDLADELQSLQQATKADAPEVVRQTIEDELGQPVEQLFREFDDVAIASASIGQVHRATLITGERVYVKVQRADIADVVRKDVEIMGWLAQLSERLPEFQPYRPTETLAEFRRTLLRELDFGREERNLQLFAMRFADNPNVEIPQPVSELCTPRVLTMEAMVGVKIESCEQLHDAGFDLEAIARNGAALYMEMIFEDGFYHADPHPGNLVLLPGNVIGLLDFGNVGRIDESLREDIEEILYAIVNRDATHLSTLIASLGRVPADLDHAAFRTDLAEFVSDFGHQTVGNVAVGSALTTMMNMIHRYRIVLPSQISTLIKTLVTLEGTSKLLSPDFSVLDIMQPYQKRAILKRFSPARRVRKMRRTYMELEHIASVLPRRVASIVDQIQAGEFDVHLDHRGLEPSVNRLVLGLLASALFLGSSLLLSMKVPPLLFTGEPFFGVHELSLLGLSGCALSLLVGLRLLRAIGKSGHLDRRK